MITAAKETPNEVAQRLMGRSYLSYSSVALYQSCPLRWYFKYVAGLPEETVSASLVFGGSIHAAVQRHFEDLLAGNPPPTLGELRAVYRASWHDRGGKEVSFGKGDDEASLDELAARMLAAFQASDIATPTGTILGVEEEIVGQLLPGCPDLLARLDLVIETKNAVVVTDFKTSRSRWSADQADDSATQLLLYLELARLLVPEKEVRVQFTVLTKAKAPAIETYPVAADPQRVNRTKRIVERVWRAIECGHFYPTPSPMQCPTCPFREPCQRWPAEPSRTPEKRFAT